MYTCAASDPAICPVFVIWKESVMVNVEPVKEKEGVPIWREEYVNVVYDRPNLNAKKK